MADGATLRKEDASLSRDERRGIQNAKKEARKNVNSKFAANDPRYNQGGTSPVSENTAVARFAQEAGKRLLQSQLQDEKGMRRRERKNTQEQEKNDAQDEANAKNRSSRARKVDMRDRGRIADNLRKILEAENETYSEGDENLLISNPPHKPPFPGKIVFLTIIKDIIDFATLTGVGAAVVIVTSFCISLILFFWTLGKIQGGWWKKKLISRLWKTYILETVVEIVPVLNFIPTSTIFVLMAHYRETKLVKLLNSALENIHAKGR